MRLGVFGPFYPEFDLLGNQNTVLALGLARDPRIERVTVFCQQGGLPPPEAQGSPIEVVPCWKREDGRSLLGAALRLIDRAPEFDAILFHTMMTAYGRGNVANAIGLALPPLVAQVTRRPTFVYMHNLMETQEVELLGYHPGLFARTGVRMLERSLLKRTTVIMPLASQVAAVNDHLGLPVVPFFFPYMEGYLAAEGIRAPGAPDEAARGKGRPFRVLLLGRWGPQKDLLGALRALDHAIESGLDLRVTVAGDENPHFPGFLTDLDYGEFQALSGRLEHVHDPPDSKVVELFLSHDLLLLPYRTVGGYSGVLNFAATVGIPTIAYDLPPLREQASLEEANTTFVRPPNLEGAIRTAATAGGERSWFDPGTVPRHRRAFEQSVARFTELIEARVRSRNGEPSSPGTEVA